MSLILSLGTNLGNKLENLDLARNLLSEQFEFIASSRVYSSSAVDYLDQPDFFNQLLEYRLPDCTAIEALTKVLEIEDRMGRVRNIAKGPRLIDIDILFWQLEQVSLENLQIPHSAWLQRPFILIPLKELPYYGQIKRNFSIPVCDPSNIRLV